MAITLLCILVFIGGVSVGMNIATLWKKTVHILDVKLEEQGLTTLTQHNKDNVKVEIIHSNNLKDAFDSNKDISLDDVLDKDYMA